MNKVLEFLAKSPIGSALKVGVGAVLAYLLDNIASFDLPPVALVFITAIAPAVINWFNPADDRYGNGSNVANAG